MIACSQESPVTESPAIQEDEQEAPHGKVTQFGRFRERGKGWIQDDPNTSTGKTIRGMTLEFTEETDRIPLRIGVLFGYRYWLKFPARFDQVSFKRVLIHPQITLPDGSKVTRSERKVGKRTTHGIVTSIDAYALSEDYELVEGEWIFQIWYEDEILAEQKFTAYWPLEE
jgi:hypothetical protein